MEVQDINAFIEEEKKRFEDAENIIAEFMPKVKDTDRQGKIRDSRLINAQHD